MSSNGYLLSLDIDRHGCRRVAALIGCVTLLALAGVNLSGIDWQPRVLAATLVLAGGLWAGWRAWPGCPGFVTRVHLSVAGQFFLERAGEPQALAPATVAQWWSLPRLALGLVFIGQSGQQAQAIVFFDQVPPDVWRRLQVRLRRGYDPGVDRDGTPARPGPFT